MSLFSADLCRYFAMGFGLGALGVAIALAGQLTGA